MSSADAEAASALEESESRGVPSSSSPDDAPPVPAEAREHFEKGIEAYKQNRDGEAVEAFQQAIRLQPDYAEAHLRLGLAYAALGQRDEAIKEYEEAVRHYKASTRRYPKDAGGHFNFGLAHTKLTRHEEAVKAYRQAVRLQPDDSDKQYELGLAYTKLAQYREAVAALERAIDLDPDNFRAVEALERARSGLNRREAFLKQQEKALEKRRQMMGNKADDEKFPANIKPSPTPVTRSP